MSVSSVPHSRNQSAAEEIGNSVSHGIGLLLAIAALPVLIVSATHHGPTSAVVGAAAFGVSAVMLYLVSLLYHAARQPHAKQFLRTLDHAAIYVLIAGTYTPFTLGVLRGAWGWTLLGLVWSMALAGVLFKVFLGVRYPRVSTALYLAMGWLVLIAIQPLRENMAAGGLIWLLAGGAAYTLGVVFYVLDKRVRFSHFVWHLFVLAGTACHFVAVLRYAY